MRCFFALLWFLVVPGSVGAGGEQATPNPCQNVQAGTKKDRAYGAFLGLAVGDALGTTLEFKKRDTYEPLTDIVGGGPFDLSPGE
jgi:ADP-ribosyl-[dinitrogen reductase] hydrolase